VKGKQVVGASLLAQSHKGEEPVIQAEAWPRPAIDQVAMTIDGLFADGVASIRVIIRD
jgi:hypothetical protein